MDTLLREYSENSDCREGEGTRDSFINLIKNVSLEDKIAKIDNTEEKPEKFPTGRVSFSIRGASKLSPLVKNNHREDSSIDMCSQGSLMGKTSLRTGNSVRHKSQQSFQQKAVRKDLSPKKETTLSQPLENFISAKRYPGKMSRGEPLQEVNIEAVNIEVKHTFHSFRMQNSGRGLNNSHRSFRGWNNLHNSFSSHGHAKNTFGNHGSVQHSLTVSDNIGHPYTGGYHKLGGPLEYSRVKKENTSRDRIYPVNLVPKKEHDRIDHENLVQKVENHFVFSGERQDILNNARMSKYNAKVVSYSLPSMKHVNNVKKDFGAECSFNDQVMPINYNRLKTRPQWISLYDLSILLSTIINIYLESFAMQKVIKDVFSTLYAIINLVEETMNGCAIHLRIISAISQNISNFTKIAEKLQSVASIIILQRDRVTESMEALQVELKSTNRCGSYSETKVLEVCNVIRRNVLGQIDNVQWLNNDLKFDCHLLQITDSSCQQCEPLMNVFQDLKKAKEYLKSQMEIIGSTHDYKRTDSNLSGENAMFNVQLVKQCSVIKQRLKDLEPLFS